MSDPDIERVKARLAALHRRGGTDVIAKRAPARAPLDIGLLEGREEATPFGPAYVIDRCLNLDWPGSGAPFDWATVSEPGALTRLARDARWSDIPLDQVLLLDTETTGLAGGTGTYVFLAGAGYFSHRRDGGIDFRVRQYFMRELGEEPAFLYALSSFLDQFRALVSFNGKSFDWPLLVTRFLLKRQPSHDRDWPHLDLLHPARRIWKHRLASCGLGALEASIFRIERPLDVPSALIPELYFRFLRDRDPRPLLPILAHNQLDITTLAALLARLVQLTTLPPEHPVLSDLRGPDRYGLAGLQLALGQVDRGISSYRRALEDPNLPTNLRRAALISLAAALKRAGHWDDAAAVWRQLVLDEARRRNPDATAYEELAKYHEHISHDYGAALGTVEAALTLMEIRGITDDLGPLHHRRARLRAKLARGHERRPETRRRAGPLHDEPDQHFVRSKSA